ncbi:MAG: linear amide C-N hydrolase [Lachnospiraceae bacterium]|nr:linear amide C-N hydrolase [Lachnospiraceae bacterium]
MKKSWLFSFPACSSMTLTSAENRPYWFRTCDIENDLRKEGAHLVRKSRGDILIYSGEKRQKAEYAYMGMTYNQKDSWLLDGINEAGLTGGLLMLPGAFSVKSAEAGYEGCMGMELVTHLLSTCRNVKEVKERAAGLQILDILYGEGYVPASMHYFFVDEEGEETVLEATDAARPGILKIYGRQEVIGVMTNAPAYPLQLKNLSWFMSCSPELCQGLEGKPIERLIFDGREIAADSLAEHISLEGIFPGSYSSHDRFIRLAVFKALNDCGNHFSKEELPALGSLIMSTVTTPPSRGLFHYSHREEGGKVVGQKESRTQYLVIYNLSERCLQLHFSDGLIWQEYRL